MYFDHNGNMQKSNVIIVCGPPASGKTTFVKEHMKVGDCVIDLDLIKSALSMRGKTQTTDNLLPTVLKIRDFLYAEIAANNIECETVWVISGLPRERDRVELKKRLNADLVFLDVPQDVCIDRAMLDGERKDKARQIEMIKKYFLKRNSEY